MDVELQVFFAGLALSLCMVGVFFYMYRSYRRRYLLVWLAGFIFVAMRDATWIGAATGVFEYSAALTVNRILNIIAALLTVIGTYAFINRRTPPALLLCGGAAIAWALGAPFWGVEGMTRFAPIYIALGTLLMASAASFYWHMNRGVGRTITTLSVGLYGVYALARLSPWFRSAIEPIAGGIDIAFLGAISISVLVIHFELARLSEQATRDELERSSRMESLGRLAGGIAHDFNNLLTVMLAGIDLADGDKPLNVRKKRLDQARSAALRASELTSQLLTFSRKAPNQEEVIDFKELTERACSMLSRLLPESVAFGVRVPESPIYVSGIPALLEQMVVNLGVNARDALEDDGKIEVMLAAENGHACLRVSDNGVGIAPENREQIFEPFFTTKALGKGTGLGLAMAYGLVRQMNGEISIESHPGEGSTFTVRLPVATHVAVARKSLVEDEPLSAVRGLRILVAEDENEVRKVFVQMLTVDGHDVQSVGDPRKALELARHADFDLVITDAMMPGLSGHDLIRAIREFKPAMRFLMVSGYDRSADALPADTLFLQKPFSVQSLREYVERSVGDLVPLQRDTAS